MRAAFLEHAGHHVTMAAVPNQPVWDLLSDGHPVQVKEGLSAAHVKEFLASHPGVTVVTGKDLAANIHHSGVTGIPELDHDAVAHSTKESIHGLKDGTHPGFHLPVVTLLSSAYREGKLFWNQKTSIEKAAAHVAGDVASVGAGLWAGTKTGAVIGSFLGPFGAAAGGLLGALAGAIAGKSVANGFRFAAFNKIRAEYLQTVEAARESIDRRIEESRTEIARLQHDYQRRLQAEHDRIEEDAAGRIGILHEAQQGDLNALAADFPSYLDEIVNQLREQEREVLSEFPRSPWGLLVPRQNDLLRTLVRRLFRRARRIALAEKRRYRRLQDRSAASLTAFIAHFLETYVWGLESLRTRLEEMAQDSSAARAKAEEVRLAAVAEATAVRDRLVAELSDRIGRLHEEVTAVIREWNARVMDCRERLKAEAAPVGIDV